MGTLTIHSLAPDVEQFIRNKARRENKSLNQVLKELLARSTGLSSRGLYDRRSDFEEFAGVWTKRDQKEFEDAVSDFEEIRQEDWQ